MISGLPRRFRAPLVLALAGLVCGCSLLPPFGARPGKTTPATSTFQAKAQKVKDLTETLSLVENEHLQQASASVRALGTSLMSALAAASAVSATVSGTRALYRLAGTEASGSSELTYDDATHEVTGLKSKDTELSFNFLNQGRSRTWTANLLKSPDGTTGRLTVEITADWVPQAEFMHPGEAPCRNPDTAPVIATPASPVAAVQAASLAPVAAESPLASPTPAEPSPSPEAEAYALLGASAAPYVCPSPGPYHWFNGEAPRAIERVTARLELTPRGATSLATHIDLTLDQPDAGLGPLLPQLTQLPTHWVMLASLPRVSMMWESRVHVALGQSTFAGSGNLTVDTRDGQDGFDFALDADEASRSATFSATNDAAKVKLLITAAQAGAGNEVHTSLRSTEDDSELGTVALDPDRPRFAHIALNDGKSVDWELYPENLLPGKTP